MQRKQWIRAAVGLAVVVAAPVWAAPPGSADGGSSGRSSVVTSFNGRTGDVVSQSGDYSFPLISGTAAKSQLPASTAYTDQSNTFSADQTLNGSLYIADGGIALPATSSPTVGVISLGGQPFLHAFGGDDVFLGKGAGNFTTTGGANVGVGVNTLRSNTSGVGNTAVGDGALSATTSSQWNTAIGSGALLHATGGANTAAGQGALCSMTFGEANTAVGYGAGVGANTDCSQVQYGGGRNTYLGAFTGPDVNSSGLNNATAVGTLAEVATDDSLVLGEIAGLNGATATVKVGIGTASPTTRLQVVDGDVSTPTAGTGLIVKSPDGSRCARIGIDNSGALTATSVTCP